MTREFYLSGSVATLIKLMWHADIYYGKRQPMPHQE